MGFAAARACSSAALGRTVCALGIGTIGDLLHALRDPLSVPGARLVHRTGSEAIRARPRLARFGHRALGPYASLRGRDLVVLRAQHRPHSRRSHTGAGRLTGKALEPNEAKG